MLNLRLPVLTCIVNISLMLMSVYTLTAVAVAEVMVVVVAGAGITTETVEVPAQIDSFMVEIVHVLIEFQSSILCTKICGGRVF